MNNRDEIIYNKIKQVVIMLDEIDEMINSQSEELQKVDYALSDWLHYIENNEISEKNSIKVIKEVQKLRKQRRCLHNEYEIEKVYKNNYSKMMGNNTRQFILAEINKAIKQLDNDYKNRILTTEEINNILDEKKKRGRPKKNND